MKTDRLEEFVKANREEFDNLEPSPEVWDKIKSDSAKSKTFKMNPVLYRVAVVVAIVIVTAAVLLKSNVLSNREYAGMTADPELRELLEAESYYAHQVNVKLKEIRKCYYTYPDVKQDVENDLTELEHIYNELKDDLKENVSNKAVIEAMIENNRFRLKLVDEVLEQINC